MPNNIVPVDALDSRGRAAAERQAAEELRHTTRPNIRTARFTKRKETPGTCVYQEQPPKGEPEIIGNLYIKKWFAESATEIIVTVEKR